MTRVSGWLMLASCGVAGVGCGSAATSGTAPRSVTTVARDEFLPAGVRTLSQGRVPHAPAFAISAERYRFEGRIYVDLAAAMEPHARLAGASGSFSPDPGQPFSWSAERGCSTHPAARWSIVYGLLRDAGDRAVAYTGRERHPVLTAPRPVSIHDQGVLGYVVLTQQPSRVLVLNPAGEVLQDERIGTPARERCNPEASGSLTVFSQKRGSAPAGLPELRRKAQGAASRTGRRAEVDVSPSRSRTQGLRR
jgi:hypothetical protein